MNCAVAAAVAVQEDAPDIDDPKASNDDGGNPQQQQQQPQRQNARDAAAAAAAAAATAAAAASSFSASFEGHSSAFSPFSTAVSGGRSPVLRYVNKPKTA